MIRLRDLRDRFVDRVIVRGACLRQPCVSQSWVKIRAVAVCVGMSLPGIAVSFGGFPAVGTVLALGLFFVSMWVIVTRLEELADQGHTCEPEPERRGDYRV